MSIKISSLRLGQVRNNTGFVFSDMHLDIDIRNTDTDKKGILSKAKAKDIIIDFSNEVYDRMNNNNQRNLIHTFGFDVIPDKDLNLWLLEMNEVPGPTVVYESRLPKAFRYFPTIFMDNMLDEIINPMQENTDVKPNNFDMVFEKQLKYNKWILV